jgi:iron complex outermembrane receptor protein
VLIKSSDVVTGGASAAYGSDAIAGVITFQTDDRFVGLKGSVQYGQTRYGDAKNKFATLAYGTSFAGGRGHAVIGGEYNDDGGTANTVLGPNGNYFGTATSGGLILTPGTLQGLAFVPNSSGGVTTTPFNRGLSNLTASLDFFSPTALAANTAAGINNLNTQQLRPAQRCYTTMGKIAFDVNDNLTAYFEPLYSSVKTTGILIIRRDGAGAGPALTIAKDNAYLAQALTPAQLALVPAGGLSIGFSGENFGPSIRTIENALIRVQTGLKGKFGAGWKWDLLYLFGQNTSQVAINNTFDSANFRNALDAVNVGGQITCRSATAVAAGCAPMSATNVSQAAASLPKGLLNTNIGYVSASHQNNGQFGPIRQGITLR